jgi:thiosulfate/3-mercaptopyruvate sulfurtransferase
VAEPRPAPGGGRRAMAPPIVGAIALTELLSSASPPALLDVRGKLGGPPGHEIYASGHLPGACYVDLDADLADPPGSGAGGRHPLPSAAAFENAMRRAGLRDGQLAVAYDDGDSLIAGRLWWLLRYFGHDQAAVLDGGLRAWSAAGLPVTTQVPSPLPGDFTAGPGGGMPVLDDDAAARVARSGILLDARVPARYRGEIEPVDPAAGHIPGAISAPALENLGADQVFLSPDDLRRRFAQLGLPASEDEAIHAGGAMRIGVYCGSGVNAAQEVLALELAGLPAALYVGSWSAWTSDPCRPVATGPDPG